MFAGSAKSGPELAKSGRNFGCISVNLEIKGVETRV
jgi:hypothetical protein